MNFYQRQSQELLRVAASPQGGCRAHGSWPQRASPTAAAAALLPGLPGGHTHQDAAPGGGGEVGYTVCDFS